MMSQLPIVFLLLVCSCFLTVAGRFVKPVPCTNPLTGENGVCILHGFCSSLLHGVHVGPCVDRLFIGTCCKILSNYETKSSKQESIQTQMDNPIDSMVKKKVKKPSSKAKLKQSDPFFINAHLNLNDSYEKQSEILFDNELNISRSFYWNNSKIAETKINPLFSASLLQFLFSPKKTQLGTINETKNKELSTIAPKYEIQTKINSEIGFLENSTFNNGSHLSASMGYNRSVIASRLIDNFREPVSFHETRNLRKPVLINEQHNLRKTVSLNEARDQRRPVVKENSHDQRPVLFQESHDLRWPVLEEESHDQRWPVLEEESHDQRWPVLEEESHDQRWPVLEEESHDQRWPVLEEESHYQSPPVPGKNSFNQRFSTVRESLQQNNHSNVNNHHPPTTEYTMPAIKTELDSLQSTDETEANANTETSRNCSSHVSEKIDSEDFFQRNLSLIEDINDGDNFLSKFTSITPELHRKSEFIEIQSINDQRVISNAISQVCGKPVVTTTARIVGGRKSHYLRWPWMISLLRYEGNAYKHKCGATLLNHLWAITAAHCVYGKFSLDVKLRIGEYNFRKDDEEYSHLERLVDVVVVHPKFDPVSYENDLALLHFIKPVRFQANIIPICLPHLMMENITGRMAIVTGWGRLHHDGELPTTLHEVQVPILSNEECEKFYLEAGFAETLKDVFVCAGLFSGGLDACEGDSGGPMVIRGDQGEWVLVGLISWGMGCAAPRQPGVYTRISKFTRWIEITISH